MKLEVLVATMNQTDLSLFAKMNIQTDVIFCNQCDRNEFIDTEINGCRVRMLSTTTRGVGINRNLALQLSDADICLCADDDVTYVNGYEKIVIDEFISLGMPSIIGFNRTMTGNIPKHTPQNSKTHKVRSVGAARMAFVNIDIKKSNICFSRLFGGGSIYSNGEDSLFCNDVRKSRLRVMSSDCVIENIDYSDSTWFEGYNEKYFFDKGAWCKAAYPNMWRVLKYYLVIKQKRLTKLSYGKIIELMNQGAKSYEKNIGYKEYLNGQETNK